MYYSTYKHDYLINTYLNSPNPNTNLLIMLLLQNTHSNPASKCDELVTMLFPRNCYQIIDGFMITNIKTSLLMIRLKSDS